MVAWRRRLRIPSMNPAKSVPYCILYGDPQIQAGKNQISLHSISNLLSIHIHRHCALESFDPDHRQLCSLRDAMAGSENTAMLAEL